MFIYHNMNVDDYRKPAHDISPIFTNRWSPRAMSGEEINREELMRLFEAARGALSFKRAFLHELQEIS